MSIDRTTPDLDTPGAAALSARAAARDAVLRGLVHALSNRVGTVGAVASVLDPAAPVAGAPAAMLQDEAGRLEQLLEEFRRFAGEPAGGPEPLHLPDLLALAVALHAHHPGLRDVPCALVGGDALPPAYAEPHAVLDALLVALDAAKGAAGAGGVRLTGDADADRVRVRVAPADVAGAAGGASAAPGVVAWSLPGGVGRATVSAGVGVLDLPTLSAARR